MLRTCLRVVRRSLVRVLPVAQPRDPLVVDHSALREGPILLGCGPSLGPLSEPARDRRVVLGGPPERRERQAAARLFRDLSLALQLREYFVVERRRRDDSHELEVLRSGPQHRGTSDVYLLDRLLL